MTSPVERALLAVRAQVAVVAPDVEPAAVVLGTSLDRLGCSSMDRAEITVMVMEALQVTLSPQVLGEIHDIDGLVLALAGELR